jgi:hypothetical protein
VDSRLGDGGGCASVMIASSRGLSVSRESASGRLMSVSRESASGRLMSVSRESASGRLMSVCDVVFSCSDDSDDSVSESEL